MYTIRRRHPEQKIWHMKYLLLFIISSIVLSLLVLAIILLTSAAIYGSLFLPIVCLITMVLFFYFIDLGNRKQEV